MGRPKVFHAVLLLSVFLLSIIAKAQVPAEEIAPLPTELSTERMSALRSLSPEPLAARAATARRPRRFFVYSLQHPLTPHDVALRESVRALGTDKHHFIRCELKSHAVVTGAIIRIDNEGFIVRTGILDSATTMISYRQLGGTPRPVAAVGEHLRNGLEWTGLVGLCVALSPLVLVFYPLVLTGVIQD